MRELLIYIYIKFTLPPFPLKKIRQTLNKEDSELLKSIFDDNLQLINGLPFADKKIPKIRERHLQRLFDIGLDHFSLPAELRELETPTLKQLTISYIQNFESPLTGPQLPGELEILLQDNQSGIFNLQPYWPLQEQEAFEMVEILLNNFGSTTNIVDEKTGLNLLHIASHCGNNFLVKEVLNSNIDVNQKDAKGNTALHYAAKNGDLAIINLLLTHQADTNVVNMQNETPLYWAAKFSNPPAFEVLYNEKVDFNLKNSGPSRINGYTLFEQAVTAGDIEFAHKILKLIPNIDVNNDNKILLLGAYRGDVDVFVLLRSMGFTPQTNKYGDTPLHFAAVMGKLEMVKHLLSMGYDINIVNHQYNETPLYLLLTFLKKERKNEKSKWGENYQKYQDHLSTVRYLIESGASLKINSSFGMFNDTAYDLIQELEVFTAYNNKKRSPIKHFKNQQIQTPPLTSLPQVHIEAAIMEPLFPSQCYRTMMFSGIVVSGAALLLGLILKATVINSDSAELRQSSNKVANYIILASLSLLITNVILVIPRRHFNNACNFFTRRIPFRDRSRNSNDYERIPEQRCQASSFY